MIRWTQMLSRCLIHRKIGCQVVDGPQVRTVHDSTKEIKNEQFHVSTNKVKERTGQCFYEEGRGIKTQATDMTARCQCPASGWIQQSKRQCQESPGKRETCLSCRDSLGGCHMQQPIDRSVATARKCAHTMSPKNSPLRLRWMLRWYVYRWLTKITQAIKKATSTSLESTAPPTLPRLQCLQ